MAFDVIPRSLDIAGSIGKCKEINNYQKRSIHTQKVDGFGQRHIHFQSSLIV